MTAATDHAAHGDHHDGHHALPLWMLLGTWGALMGLTILTVFSAQFDIPTECSCSVTKPDDDPLPFLDGREDEASYKSTTKAQSGDSTYKPDLPLGKDELCTLTHS